MFFCNPCKPNRFRVVNFRNDAESNRIRMEFFTYFSVSGKDSNVEIELLAK